MVNASSAARRTPFCRGFSTGYVAVPLLDAKPRATTLYASDRGPSGRQGGSMTAMRVALLTAFSVAVWAAPEAQALVLGGKKAASDCYLTFEGITGTAPTIECTDGSECDA